MKWRILYARERWEEVEAQNINYVAEIANQNKKKGERVVSIITSGHQIGKEKK